MRIIKLMIISAFVLGAVIGCAKHDEEDIQSLLERSWYVGEASIQTADDSTSTPRSFAGPGLDLDTIPFVRWVRHIERPVEWDFNITIDGDTAEAIITAHFQGTPPGFGLFVLNDTFAPIYVRAISDSLTRKVRLYRDDDGWHILALTVADMRTAGTIHPVTISSVRAEVTSRSYVFEVTSADQYFTKDQLPRFYPSDTVAVTVTCSILDDSCWAFLHHGAGHRPGVGLRHHWREPFYRENTTTFTHTWIIASDSVVTTPAVRHSAVDVIGWQTLWGDSTAAYYSRAWGLPYIIAVATDTLPADEE